MSSLIRMPWLFYTYAKSKRGKLKSKRRSLLDSSSIPRPMLALFTVVCSVAGFLAGKIIYNSLLVSVCVAAFGSFVPILFLSLRQNKAITASGNSATRKTSAR